MPAEIPKSINRILLIANIEQSTIITTHTFK